MAAPTAVRVFATAVGATRIKWAYSGGSDVKVYRSTDGSSYASVATVSPGTTGLYDDTGLANKTKYWYKLTDDNGSTFSSVVTVVTYVEVSKRQGNSAQFISSKNSPQDLQNLQDKLAGQDVQSQPCDLCLVDQALVIDCTSGCEWFRTVLDTDVNSITLLGCDDCPPVDFIVPPNTTRNICGWPMGCDYFGDECYSAGVPGGTHGRTAKTNGLSYDGYGPSPTIPGGCCPPGTLTLSIQCCSDDCELTCS